MKVEIPEDKLKNLSKKAQKELESSTKEFAEEVIKEADRLEVSRRSRGNTEQEITKDLIKKSVEYKKDPDIMNKNSSKGITIKKTIAFASALTTGALFDIQLLQESTIAIFALFISFTIALMSTYISNEEGG